MKRTVLYTFILLIIIQGGVFAQSRGYTNPVINKSTPDPTIIRAEDESFYLYATEDIRNAPIYKSDDLVNWTFQGTVFTNSTRPTFEPNGGIWAPDINYINGQYVMYYSMSVWGGEQTCGIGVATARNPGNHFHDRGKLFRSNEIGVQNSIDPCYIEDNGKHYLFWGSFRGIYCVELSDDGLSLKNPDNPQKVQIAGTAFEATYIHKRGDYYYLFASIGTCCEGLKSSYEVVVGRSTSLKGPYLNKDGRSMMDNHFNLLIGSNSRFKGNGHCSEIVQDDNGNDWILFHGYDVHNEKNGRIVLLNQIKWDENDWPYVDGASPAINASKPYFKPTGLDPVSDETVILKRLENKLELLSDAGASVDVYSCSGQLINSFSKSKAIHISLNKGLYLVHIQTSDKSYLQKIYI